MNETNIEAILYPVERDGTVPMKPWKHGGGMAISRQQSIN